MINLYCKECGNILFVENSRHESIDQGNILVLPCKKCNKKYKELKKSLRIIMDQVYPANKEWK